jgi:D-alanyl-D-alanine carboxypeptidase
MPKPSVTAAAVATLAALTVPALSAATPAQDLQRGLDRLVARDAGPPGAIAVVRTPAGTRVLTAGVGNTRTGARPRQGDRMRVASVAKAFSGGVALRLVQQGRLRLDSTIGEVLPDLPASWHRITLTQLLQHTSGLPDFSQSEGFRAFVGADPGRSAPPERLLGFVADQDPQFPPGSRYRYSNTDNAVVGLMAAEVTGTDYDRALRTLVARPLGLTRTSLPSTTALPPPAIRGYARGDDGAPEDVTTLLNPTLAYASGGVVSTPAEMGAFFRAYVGGRLFGPAIRRAQAAWRPGSSEPTGPGRNDAGLGLFRYTTRCGVVYGHTGNTPGYTQFAAASRDGRRSVTVSVNQQLQRTPLMPELRRVYELGVCAALR